VQACQGTSGAHHLKIFPEALRTAEISAADQEPSREHPSRSQTSRNKTRPTGWFAPWDGRTGTRGRTNRGETYDAQKAHTLVVPIAWSGTSASHPYTSPDCSGVPPAPLDAIPFVVTFHAD
jgi:hypothetical protein